MATGDAFTVAVIGAGGIAKAHAAAAAESGGRVKIAAFADPNAEAAKALAGPAGASVHASADEVFAAFDKGELKIHGVVVCTPPNVRSDVIGKALARRLAVLVEKPLASGAAEARKLAELSRANPGVVCAVGYCHRFAPAVVEMKKLVGEGKIGRLTRFENAFAFHHPPMSGRWFSDPSVSGGGSFIDTGCHSLDLFHFLVGPSAVAGSVYDHDWKGRGESSATVLVKAKDGAHKGVAGVILAGWLEPERFTVDLVGTGGSLHYDYMAGEDLVFKGADSKPHVIKLTTHEVRFKEQLLGWAAAARGGARGNLAGFAEGLLAAESVDAAAAAARG